MIKQIDFLDVKEIDHWSGPAKLVNFISSLNENINVLEIGTGYGQQLQFFAKTCNHVVCVDAMYHWVPDVKKEDGFQENKVDESKMNSWKTSCESFSDKVTLIVGNSFLEETINDERHKKYDVIIIDGCHHPKEAVENDYWNYQKYMNYPHYALFDDINQTDPGKAFETVKALLKERGFKLLQEQAHQCNCSTVGLILVDR